MTDIVPRTNWRLLGAVPVALLAACAQPDVDCPDAGKNAEISCWYRTYDYGPVTIQPCPADDVACAPTGYGDEVACRCPADFCDCIAFPDMGNQKDGIDNLFGCVPLSEICYQGSPSGFGSAGDCECYAGFFCWRECKGRWVVEGDKAVCRVDGRELECYPVPMKNDSGRVVLCRYGIVPHEWPLDQ